VRRVGLGRIVIVALIAAAFGSVAAPAVSLYGLAPRSTPAGDQDSSDSAGHGLVEVEVRGKRW
jgi:hypothetical protein